MAGSVRLLAKQEQEVAIAAGALFYKAEGLKPSWGEEWGLASGLHVTLGRQRGKVLFEELGVEVFRWLGPFA